MQNTFDHNNSGDSSTANSLGLNDFKQFLKEYELERIHTEFLSRTMTLVIASLGLITALTWDDTLHALLRLVFGDTPTLTERFAYTIIITFLAVGLSILIGKIFFKTKHK